MLWFPQADIFQSSLLTLSPAHLWMGSGVFYQDPCYRPPAMRHSHPFPKPLPLCPATDHEEDVTALPIRCLPARSSYRLSRAPRASCPFLAEYLPKHPAGILKISTPCKQKTSFVSLLFPSLSARQ